jgi:hypothetical protein
MNKRSMRLGWTAIRWVVAFVAVSGSLLLIAAGPVTTPSAVPTTNATPDPADALAWPQPWHMLDQWWTFKNPIPHFQSLSVDVTLDRDVPSDVNLYVSPIGLGSFGQKRDFYGGLQTNANGWPSKSDHTRAFIGHGAIFSEWGKELSVAYAQGVEGTHYEAADYEGDFLSVRHAVAFGKGTYTYTLAVDRTETVDNKPYTWITCKVHDHQTNADQTVGTLRFPGSDLTLSPSLANFVEIYSTARIPRSKVPTVTIHFGWPVVNGVCPPIKWVSVIHPSGKESSASPDLARATVDGSSIQVQIDSQPFARNAKERRYRLHPAMPATQTAR